MLDQREYIIRETSGMVGLARSEVLSRWLSWRAQEVVRCRNKKEAGRPSRDGAETEDCSKEPALHNMYDSFLLQGPLVFDVGLENEGPTR